MSLYYEDEYVQLHHGDCRAVRGWTLADVLVTDPPYGIAWKRSANNNRGSRANGGIANDGDTSVRDAALQLWGTEKPAAVFGSFRAPSPEPVSDVLVWRKGPDTGVVGATRGWRRDTELIYLSGRWPRSTRLESSVVMTTSGNRSYTTGEHPHTKPLDLMRYLIERVPPGVIADPFAGSGSTLVAARELGRKAVGVELDERYCEVIASRLSQQAFNFSEFEGIR